MRMSSGSICVFTNLNKMIAPGLTGAITLFIIQNFFDDIHRALLALLEGAAHIFTNDANAEYIGTLRKVMDDAHVTWQTAELGKVDYGGGGTISYIAARYGMEVIDCGVPVLNMHAPWEIISKADLYEAMKGYHAFLSMKA